MPAVKVLQSTVRRPEDRRRVNQTAMPNAMLRLPVPVPVLGPVGVVTAAEEAGTKAALEEVAEMETCLLYTSRCV